MTIHFQVTARIENKNEVLHEVLFPYICFAELQRAVNEFDIDVNKTVITTQFHVIQKLKHKTHILSLLKQCMPNSPEKRLSQLLSGKPVTYYSHTCTFNYMLHELQFVRLFEELREEFAIKVLENMLTEKPTATHTIISNLKQLTKESPYPTEIYCYDSYHFIDKECIAAMQKARPRPHKTTNQMSMKNWRKMILGDKNE